MSPADPAQQRYCPGCGRYAERFGRGPDWRPDARCPHCGSLERHRFLAVLLQGLAPVVRGARVLDIAPSGQTTALLRRLGPAAYVRVDLDPAADQRAVDVQASVTALPFAAGSIDLALCSHVLEHVPDDRAAMAELCRVLSDGGRGLVAVPWQPGAETDEDPAASGEERVRRFGQADHVRYYGDDFEDRLALAGLAFVRIMPQDVVGERLVRLLRLRPHEPVWVVGRGGAYRPGPCGPGAVVSRASGLSADGSTADVADSSGLAQVTLHALGELATDRQLAIDRARAELGRQRERAAAAERRLTAAEQRAHAAEQRARAAEQAARRWEAAYRRLRGRLPIRLLAAAARPARAVCRRLSRD